RKQVKDVLDAAAVQTAQSAAPFRAGNATLTPLAAFSVSARVLSREDYSFGRESGFSPTDLALGWGPMSAPGMAERLDVTQRGRLRNRARVFPAEPLGGARRLRRSFAQPALHRRQREDRVHVAPGIAVEHRAVAAEAHADRREHRVDDAEAAAQEAFPVTVRL